MAKKQKCEKLFDKSVAAVLVAVELYNKPYFSYREESFVLFIIHAWEMLLKAKWLKENNNKESCLYVKTNGRGYEKTHAGTLKTHGLDKMIGLLKGKNLLQDEVIRNLEVFRVLRNSVEHFLTESKTLKEQIPMYALANLQNFRLLAKEWFDKNLDDMNMPVPLSLKEPTPSVSSSANKGNKDIRALLSYLERETQGSSDPKSPYAVKIAYKISFKKDNKNGIPIKYDENGIPVYLSDEQFAAKFPYTYNQLLCEIKKQCPNVKRNRFNALIKRLRDDDKEQLQWHERKLNPKNSKSQKTRFYSEEFLKKMINICKSGVPSQP